MSYAYYIVKSVSIYDDKTFTNGTIQQKAEFKIGVSIMTFTYYLVLTYEPKYNSFTWTLDYSRSSDFGKLVCMCMLYICL